MKIFLSLKTKEKLATTSIYRAVRHPLYLSNGLFSLGLSLLVIFFNAFLFLILYSSLYLPIIYFEERDLLKKYGKKYKRYREEVELLFLKKIKINQDK